MYEIFDVHVSLMLYVPGFNTLPNILRSICINEVANRRAPFLNYVMFMCDLSVS